MNGGTHKKWHQGVVSRAYRSRAGEMSYNGEATMAGSRRSFQDTPLAELRVAPNVMDCLAE